MSANGRKLSAKSNDSLKLNDDLKKVNDMWKIIDQQINDPNSKYLLMKTNAQKSKRLKPIRVFVSSTFTDFFSEREILVKQFFPELREWCLRRNLDLIECDLRWGVPAETTSDDTILTCLRELDRCYKENDGEPFFIGLLGEKYGWVPDITKLSSELVQEYNWIPNISITFMEYLHGALRSKNSNACFFIRSKESLDGIPPEFNEKFFETVPFSKLHLQIEKEKLRSDYKKQVVEYSCKFDGFDETTGRKRPKLSGLEDFGHQVLEFLKNAIMRTYPDAIDKINDKGEVDESQVFINTIEEESYYHELFITEKTDFVIGFEEYTQIVYDYINDGKISDSFKLSKYELPDSIDNENFSTTHTNVLFMTDINYVEKVNDNKEIMRPLIIFGDEGSGKSILASTVMKLFLDTDVQPFYHLFSVSSKSQYEWIFQARFIDHFSKLLGIPVKEVSLDGHNYETSDTFEQVFELLIAAKFKKVILIDDVDSTVSQVSDYRWFKLFNRVEQDDSFRIIITLNSKSKNQIRFVIWDGTYYCLNLDYFDKNTSKLYIEKYLAKYNKKLDDKQMTTLLSKSEQNSNSLSPLWLSYVCNELRIFGEFTTINKKIESFPIDLTNLIVNIVKRVNADFKENVVIDLLCFISFAYYGIPENEICILLQQIGHQISRIEFSQISVNLKNFLKFESHDGSHIIKFSERRLYTIMEDYFIKKNEEDENNQFKTKGFYLAIFINYFRYFSQYRSIAVNQCYFSYRDLNQKREIVEFIQTEEAMRYINSTLRCLAFNFARCQSTINGTHFESLKMCTGCSTKASKGFFQNINSCYICGENAQMSKKLVYRCARHATLNMPPPNHYKCCYCGQLYSKTPKVFTQTPLDVHFCVTCNGTICCEFDY